MNRKTFIEARRELTLTAELVHGVLERFDQTWVALIDAQPGQPAAATYDTDGRGAGTIWCDDHERDVKACHRDDLPCCGVPVGFDPDPTGDAAVSGDKAAADLRLLVAAAHTLATKAELLDGIRRAWTIPISVAGLAGAGDPGCQSCARLGRWELPITDRATTIAGRLKAPCLLCRWCYDWARRFEALPSKQQLEDHHTGKKVRLPA